MHQHTSEGQDMAKEGIERRVFERFKVNFPAKFSCPAVRLKGMGKVVDIGAGGSGMLVTDENLKPDMHLSVWIKITDDKDDLQASGVVVWSSQLDACLYKIGIKFDKVDFMGISRALKMKIKRFSPALPARG